jgi:hypothetical protein
MEMMTGSVTTIAAAVETSAMKAAAMERDAATSEPAAMECDATTVEAAASATVEPAPVSSTAAMSTAAMSATASTTMTTSGTDFRRQCIGRVLRRGCGGRIDQGHRRRALTRRDGQHQHRRSRKAPAADNAGLQHFHHV